MREEWENDWSGARDGGSIKFGALECLSPLSTSWSVLQHCHHPSRILLT